jgi:hypothetical protein
LPGKTKLIRQGDPRFGGSSHFDDTVVSRRHFVLMFDLISPVQAVFMRYEPR